MWLKLGLEARSSELIIERLSFLKGEYAAIN
jgi:hypothetical protein